MSNKRNIISKIKTWSFWVPIIKGIIITAVVALLGWIGNKVYEEAKKYCKSQIAQKVTIEVKNQINLQWAKDEFIKNLKNDVIGFSYQAYFMLGSETGKTSYYIPIYFREQNNDVKLYLDVTHIGTLDEEYSKIGIFLDGKEIPVIMDNKEVLKVRKDNIKITIPLNKKSGIETKGVDPYDFDGNVHTVEFRIVPSNRKIDTVSIKALINISGVVVNN